MGGAPKKKGKGKGDKGKGKEKGDKGAAAEGEEVSEEQLKETIANLKIELEHEREERNYFQLERDKINTFWEITKKELEDRKAELRNKDREMEELEERHQVEVKVYKQKVRRTRLTSYRMEARSRARVQRSNTPSLGSRSHC